MTVRTCLMGLFMAGGIAAGSIGTAAAQAAAPAAGYTLEEKYTRKSPDGSVTIEQYLNKETDEWKFTFWVRRQGTFAQLDPEPADYPAGFVFTSDLKWIVRGQKTGSGESTLYLYRRTPHREPPVKAAGQGRLGAFGAMTVSALMLPDYVAVARPPSAMAAARQGR